MLFTDGNGRLLVVEAKGCSGIKGNAHGQAEALAAVLRSKYPGRGVFAAVWCPLQPGIPFEWVPGHEPQEAETSSSSSSSSSSKEGGSSCREALPVTERVLPADAFHDHVDTV
jgi:hypothetical protein